MSSNRTPDHILPYQGVKLRYPDHEISWAGECPWTGGVCFGTEEGKLLIPATDGTGRLDVHVLAGSGEAINGIAFAGDRFLAASTRDEVVFFERHSIGDRIVPVAPPFEGGAHGVVATSEGGFVAPLGYFGVLFRKVGSDRTTTQAVATPESGDKNFYRLVRLGTSGQGDVLAGALRKGGTVGMVISGAGNILTSVNYLIPGFDVISTCPVGNAGHPFAAAFLDADRRILFSRDVLKDAPSHALEFEASDGTAYTVLSAKGHLFYLTSEDLVILPNLVSRFLAGDALDQGISFSVIQRRAVEAYVVYDRSILLEETDGIADFQIDEIVKEPPASERRDRDWPKIHGVHPLTNRLTYTPPAYA